MNNQIPSLPKELLQLIRHGENYQIEYKEAKTDLPKTLFDSVCAFSNREGGDIFLGVHDTGVILGVDSASAQKLITNFVTLANNKADDLTVKKLVRKNPTMKAKFDALN